jgi:glycosyltransferase involved in cell wall biosynthesis
MSVYNNQNTVEESINSILNQSYKNIEFLIIDDSSEDNTYKVLAQFQNHKDIKLFRNTDNLGLTKSLNSLFKRRLYSKTRRR